LEVNILDYILSWGKEAGFNPVEVITLVIIVFLAVNFFKFIIRNITSAEADKVKKEEIRLDVYKTAMWDVKRYEMDIIGEVELLSSLYQIIPHTTIKIRRLLVEIDINNKDKLTELIENVKKSYQMINQNYDTFDLDTSEEVDLYRMISLVIRKSGIMQLMKAFYYLFFSVMALGFLTKTVISLEESFKSYLSSFAIMISYTIYILFILLCLELIINKKFTYTWVNILIGLIALSLPVAHYSQMHLFGFIGYIVLDFTYLLKLTTFDKKKKMMMKKKIRKMSQKIFLLTLLLSKIHRF
jgi:hypothetical protein